MTGNASCQQFGVDAMMSSSCFLSSMVGADAAMIHVPEYMPPHDGSLGLGGFMADDGAALAGQLQLAPQQSVSPEEAHGGYYSVASGYGPSPSDVTVALPPTAAARLAGEEPERSWVQEQYYWPTSLFSGDGFRDPFTAVARELSFRLAAEPSSTGTVVNLPDQSSDVSCSGLTHTSSSAGRHGMFQPHPAYGGGGEQGTRPAGRPSHFSQIMSSRSGYAHVVQQTLDEFVGCLLQDVAGGAATGEEANCPLPSSSSSITTPSNQSMMFPSAEGHPHHKQRNDLLKLLQLVNGPTVQSVSGRDAERGVQVRQHGASSGRRRSVRAVRAECGVRDAPAAEGADRRRDRGGRAGAAEGAGTASVVVGVAGREGAELGVRLHPEALGDAAASAGRAAVLAAAARPAGEVRRRAQGLDVRELPPPVSERQREGDAGGEERPEQEPGLQLVHQRACSTVEADDRGDVRGSQEGRCRQRDFARRLKI